VAEAPSNLESVAQAIACWWSRRFDAPLVHAADWDLGRDVSEILDILELPAKERTR